MHAHITVRSAVVATPRVEQVRGMFDLPRTDTSTLSWNVSLPIEDEPWNIGLIVGPSGCGKSTIARRLFPEMADPWPFAERLSSGAVVDSFPEAMPIQEIIALLSAVGFSSPPAWLRPFGVLSTGQQFRVTLALLLAWMADDRPIVFDEFTSVVDRTVAQIGSAALAKIVRRRGQRFIAVTCHDDVEAWLQPDWVYRPAEGSFTRRLLRRRPRIDLDIARCGTGAWRLYAPHHYLSHAINPMATCFEARWQGRPVAFSAWLPFVGKSQGIRREHRTVTLPDFQGVGIGNALSDFVAGLWTGLGYRALSTTTHPALIRARLRSDRWRIHRKPALATGRAGKLRHAVTRLTAGFTYIGPGLPRDMCRVFLEGPR